MKNIALTLLRILLSILICWLLIAHDMMNLAKLPEFISNPYFIIATLFSLLTLATSIFRFWYLTGKRKSISIVEIGKIVWSSTFLNTYVPSGISGDIYKGLMLKNHISPVVLAAYIIFDKAIGLYAMILISAICSLMFFTHDPIFQLFSLSISVGGFVAFFFSKKLGQLSASVSPKISTLFNSIYAFKKQAFFSLLISMAAYLLGGLSIYFLGVAINSNSHPNLSTIYIAVPYALVVAAFPILPGSIGSGHMAFAYVFKQVGFTNGADIFTLYLLLQSVIALVGLLFLKREFSHPSTQIHPE